MVSAAASRSPAALRWLKFYFLVNGFCSIVALLTHHITAYFEGPYAFVALYAAGLLRILVMVRWFELVASLKGKIYGDKRHELTAAQRRSIYFRICWLAVPTEWLQYSISHPRLRGYLTGASMDAASFAPVSMTLSSFLVEFALFIPKSLVFEVSFDLFHYIAHWACHQIKFLYQHFHKRHHMHIHPCALSTYEQDAGDLVLSNILPYILALVLSPTFSPFQLDLLFAYKTYIEVAGHSGMEVKGFSFPQFPLVNAFGICLRVHDHDLHHTHPRFNFSKRFSLWDKVFRTFQNGRPVQESVKVAPETHKQDIVKQVEQSTKEHAQ